MVLPYRGESWDSAIKTPLRGSRSRSSSEAPRPSIRSRHTELSQWATGDCWTRGAWARSNPTPWVPVPRGRRAPWVLHCGYPAQPPPRDPSKGIEVHTFVSSFQRKFSILTRPLLPHGLHHLLQVAVVLAGCSRRGCSRGRQHGARAGAAAPRRGRGAAGHGRVPSQGAGGATTSSPTKGLRRASSSAHRPAPTARGHCRRTAALPGLRGPRKRQLRPAQLGAGRRDCLLGLLRLDADQDRVPVLARAGRPGS